MKLALLHYAFPPVVGGVERVLAGQAQVLAQAGHEVTVYAGEGRPMPYAQFELIPTLRRAGGEGDFEKEAASLRALLRPHLEREQVVFLHNVCTMPFHPALTMALWDLAAELPGTRFVCWVHDLAAAQAEYAFPAGPDRPWGLLRSASPNFEYVAVSEWRREQVVATLGLPPERCRVIPNGLWPLEHWSVPPALQRIASEAGLLERGLVLLHPTRLVRRKNVEESLRILAEIRALGCDAALLITGAADPHQPASVAYGRELGALRDALGLQGHAIFLGEMCAPLDEPAVDSLYRLCDAVLLPSLQEGFGLPVLEAAIHGKPIFAPRLPPLLASLGDRPEFYSAGDTCAQVAFHLIRQLGSFPSIHGRRSALRTYAWPALYRKYIGPLLAERPINPSPQPT